MSDEEEFGVSAWVFICKNNVSEPIWQWSGSDLAQRIKSNQSYCIVQQLSMHYRFYSVGCNPLAWVSTRSRDCSRTGAHPSPTCASACKVALDKLVLFAAHQRHEAIAYHSARPSMLFTGPTNHFNDLTKCGEEWRNGDELSKANKTKTKRGRGHTSNQTWYVATINMTFKLAACAWRALRCSGWR